MFQSEKNEGKNYIKLQNLNKKVYSYNDGIIGKINVYKRIKLQRKSKGKIR